MVGAEMPLPLRREYPKIKLADKQNGIRKD